jgi:2-polyprenyl-3-methyl-5-hydroxy-6-metoxy-1,4-benzoquinol methylase
MTAVNASVRLRNAARDLRSLLTSGGARQHNMNEDDGERYYLEQYLAVLAPHLRAPRRVLDVGCQYGRVLLSLAADGHELVGTDPDQACLDYIRARHADVELRCESVEQTVAGPPGEPFDLVLCLELLYLLADWRSIIVGLSRLTAPSGHLVTSHRTRGYYLYRLLHERRFDELDDLLAGRHESLNAQSPEELREAYDACGLAVRTITPIGAFSGIGVDPFTVINDPGGMSARDRRQLARYETNPALVAGFINNARYLLVVAAPIDASS